ncbi:hypothetical protein LX32DRAFT_263767 [Colletotrichum zoysiae]|uniref:Uncharacterized protein n=1 Tax=Colletotrichum zoysiae TaxID=1216348 RepID=A0AAD9H2Q7_9PEZI|nr:hypothetical protein LX32DRAFT_263767 [Colletotrichum zoysiae]
MAPEAGSFPACSVPESWVSSKPEELGEGRGGEEGIVFLVKTEASLLYAPPTVPRIRFGTPATLAHPRDRVFIRWVPRSGYAAEPGGGRGGWEVASKRRPLRSIQRRVKGSVTRSHPGRGTLDSEKALPSKDEPVGKNGDFSVIQCTWLFF